MKNETNKMSNFWKKLNDFFNSRAGHTLEIFIYGFTSGFVVGQNLTF